MVFWWHRLGSGRANGRGNENMIGAKPLDFGRIARSCVISLLAVLLFVTVVPKSAPAAEARVLAGQNSLDAGFLRRSLTLRLQFDRAVPFRVFTLDAPRRLVVDFEGLAAESFDPATMELPSLVSGARYGRTGPGWTRLILDLARPLSLDTAEMRSEADGAEFEVRSRRVGAGEFAARAGAPPGVWPEGEAPGWWSGATGRPIIVLDPGHGGLDPGAFRDGIAEKDVVLAFARDLRAALIATGQFDVVMTREGDTFVALAERVAMAERAGAAAFVSLHTNAVEDTSIGGVIAFTQSVAGSSRAARDRALLENRSDRVAGLSQIEPDDPVMIVLDGMARIEGAARSAELARALAAALGPLVGPTTQDPLQSANFQVLKAPAMPSVLLEVGFLSNARDRRNMLSPDWRRRASAEIARALARWADPARSVGDDG